MERRSVKGCRRVEYGRVECERVKNGSVECERVNRWSVEGWSIKEGWGVHGRVECERVESGRMRRGRGESGRGV